MCISPCGKSSYYLIEKDELSGAEDEDVMSDIGPDNVHMDDGVDSDASDENGILKVILEKEDTSSDPSSESKNFSNSGSSDVFCFIFLISHRIQIPNINKRSLFFVEFSVYI